MGIFAARIYGDPAAGLRVIDEILQSYTELIANPAAAEDPAKRHAMGQIHTLLQGVLEARDKVLVKLNVGPGDLDADVAGGALTARVIHTDLERTGWFDSSEPDLDRLHENVVWGMRGNFVDIPTDCPQRDERLAWTGDMAFAREAWPAIERHLAWEKRLFRRPFGPRGLPPAVRERLFRPFSGAGRSGGTGLGLSIARDLLRGHGGDIELGRTGEDGTAFRLTLPMDTAERGPSIAVHG